MPAALKSPFLATVTVARWLARMGKGREDMKEERGRERGRGRESPMQQIIMIPFSAWRRPEMRMGCVVR